jgi:hypothetical protein
VDDYLPTIGDYDASAWVTHQDGTVDRIPAGENYLMKPGDRISVSLAPKIQIRYPQLEDNAEAAPAAHSEVNDGG